MLGYDLCERDVGAPMAVLLHPHPDMGGNRHHPVVDALYRELPLSTLRFDFTSSDTATAQAEAREAIRLAPGRDVILLGYSFGADLALTIDDGGVLGWFLVAPPLRVPEHEASVATDPRPKRLAVPEHDQFSSPARALELTSTWSSTSVVTLPRADHFLFGHEQSVVEAALIWLRTLWSDPSST